MNTTTRHQITLVANPLGGWHVTVQTRLFDPSLEVDEDEIVYWSFTFATTVDQAFDAARTMVNVGAEQVGARHP